jgi:hypothetical protein
VKKIGVASQRKKGRKASKQSKQGASTENPLSF